MSIFTFDEPLNNQSFENWVEVNKTDEKDQGQVDDFKIDTLLESTVRQQNQKELASHEIFMGSQITTTIEASDIPCEYFLKCLDQLFHLDESKTWMDAVLENIKLVKIYIPLLNVIKQLPAYATLLKKFCTLIKKSLTHISIFSNTPLSRFKDYVRKLFNFLVQHQKAIYRG